MRISDFGFAQCHPARPVVGKGMCGPCYRRELRVRKLMGEPVRPRVHRPDAETLTQAEQELAERTARFAAQQEARDRVRHQRLLDSQAAWREGLHGRVADAGLAVPIAAENEPADAPGPGPDEPDHGADETGALDPDWRDRLEEKPRQADWLERLRASYAAREGAR